MARGKNKLNFLIKVVNNDYKYNKFRFFSNLHNSLINNNDNNNIKEVDINFFGSYLAGLFEGDGHIWIPSNKLMKKHNPRFCITFNKNDLPLANAILKRIEYGFIRIKSKENAIVLTVSPIKGLMVILNLISNYLRTPKINQVNKLINWLNIYHNTNLKELVKNEKPLIFDYWLSGFIDADGGFLINYSKYKLKEREIIKFTMTIEQRMIDPITQESYEWILNMISKFFKVNLRIRCQKSTQRSYYRIVISSRKSLDILINYLDMYPLLSSKYLNYLDWKLGLLIKYNNKPLSDINKIDIFKLKINMNKKRTYYNWDHLKKSNFFHNE
jgi:LAGLIDADG endonuclease